MKTCKNSVVRIHLGEEFTVFVSMLMPNEASKNAVNAINGISKVVTGLVMKTLDDLDQRIELQA